jgi:hypothetical protein
MLLELHPVDSAGGQPACPIAVIVRQGSTLHFTSKGYRENSLVREAREHLAVE